MRLTAKKLMVLTKYSNELNEDAVLNIGDDLAGEIAYAFALKEDQCGFLGDGTSTYGGITGVTTALLNVFAGTPANVDGPGCRLRLGLRQRIRVDRPGRFQSLRRHAPGIRRRAG